MATYVVNSASGITPGEFFPDAGVTRNARSATTATYTLPDGRVVVVSGTGFDPGAASPTTGVIAAVELRQGATVLAAFSGLTNVSLPTFDSHWLVTGSSFFPFSDLLTGNDTLTGNAGDDSFVGGLGDDAINGGAGFDEVVYHNDGRSAGVTVDLNDGDPSDNVGKAWAGSTPVPAPGVEIDALTAIEAALGTRFDDLLIGDDHDNTFAPGRGTDSVDGGAGFDELRYDRPGNVTSVGITVVFTADGLGTVIASSVTGDVNTSFTGIEGVRGTAQADIFTGAAGSQRFRGLGGNDTFDGGADDDEVDFLRDTNNPGGLGVTVALGDPALGGSASGPGGNDLLRNIERVRGTINGDNITGNSQGNDFVFGHDGGDTINGGVGNDTLGGGNGNDRIDGGNGNDRIDGGTGSDTLIGGAGVDTLTGGRGRDVMTGGAARDLFDFNIAADTGRTASTRDVIRDFTHLTDDIDVSTIDANGSAAGNAAFTFLAARGAAFTGVKGQLHWFQLNPSGSANDKTIVEGDINGDRRADFQIELIGLKTLTKIDFIL